ncbi:MAG: sodium:calcium antiporter [Xanthomonadales bacterium]|jgi:cation:H+ antiporter|nr:sodium:calcium antiporter [Xanthomonadales bacterium]
MTEFLLLLTGMAGLWLGSEILMRGAMALSDRFNASDALFGMLVLAIGTDLPELFVAVDASLRSLAGEDLSGIVIGSAVGSSIGQFGLVFGTAGFLGFEAMRRQYLGRNAFFLLGSILALGLVSLDGRISRVEGACLVAFYASYLFILISRRGNSPDVTQNHNDLHWGKAWLLLALGLVVLWASARLTVASAVDFAALVGLSNIAVSAVIIGMGSSLPEVSVSFMALLKRRAGLSVGNLVGSNVLDTLLVPGLAAAISPLVVPGSVLLIDLPVLFGITGIVLWSLYVSRRGIHAPQATVLLAIYLVYAGLRLADPALAHGLA